LPSTLIYSVTQSLDGYIWLGTSDAVIRFDGVRFVPWRATSGHRALLGTIRAVCAARDGSVWVGSTSGLVGRFDGARLQTYKVGAGIEAVIETSESQIWVLAENGLYRFSGTSPSEPTPEERIDPARLSQLLAAGGGNVSLGARATPGADRVAARNAVRVSLSGNELLLNKGENGTVWLHGIESVAPRRFSVSLRDRRGSLWISKPDGGLFREIDGIQSGQVELARDIVRCLYEDREGNIWIGTNNGLYRFRVGKIFSLTEHGGLTSNEITSLAAGGQSIWAAAPNGVNEIRDAKVRQYLHGIRVLSVAAARNHTIWMATTRGVFRTSQSTANVNPDLIVPGLTSVTAMAEDFDGGVWLSDTNKGLHRWQAGRLTSFAANPLLSYRAVTTLHGEENGLVWIGFFGGGLATYKAGETREFSTRDGLPSGTINDIYKDSAGTIWLATETGLSRFDGKHFTTWNAENGLPGNRVLWLVADQENGFWLGFSTGITRVRSSELNNTGRSSSRKLQCDFYDFRDGLIANPDRVFQTAAVLDGDGRVWFTTSTGVAVIDPKHVEKNPVPPPVTIERVVADGHERKMNSIAQLAPGTKSLEIDYTGLSFAEPRKVTFRYRLEGYDNEWQEAGTRRQAFYTNLDPYTYRFRVLAANNDGVWNEQGATVAFTILPAFYQTGYFKLLCSGLLAALAWAIYRIRVRQVRAALNARFEERLVERTRIAQDLHDELLQNAMGVSLQLELADELTEERDAAKAPLQRALKLSQRLLAQGREVLRELRTDKIASDDITKTLSQTVEEYKEQHKEPEATLIVEGKPRALNPHVAADFLQIGRQAISNAFRHASARRIEVDLTYGASHLCLAVRDDGCGMDPQLAEAGKPGHFGLIGMRERAERIHAVLTIASRIGEGTEVRLNVPAQVAFYPSQRHD
jgi:signal transduction histidine kinase/ligand-binding sensor domain-containing protein